METVHCLMLLDHLSISSIMDKAFNLEADKSVVQCIYFNILMDQKQQYFLISIKTHYKV